mmetsp:Transcript_139859/g.363573  ORF Transcript_139859/g.363573 Transcript_139859/m.363573 type:complete len:259 (-) Transcript_139859:785-1561(-)
MVVLHARSRIDVLLPPPRQRRQPRSPCTSRGASATSPGRLEAAPDHRLAVEEGLDAVALLDVKELRVPQLAALLVVSVTSQVREDLLDDLGLGWAEGAGQLAGLLDLDVIWEVPLVLVEVILLLLLQHLRRALGGLRLHWGHVLQVLLRLDVGLDARKLHRSRVAELALELADLQAAHHPVPCDDALHDELLWQLGHPAGGAAAVDAAGGNAAEAEALLHLLFVALALHMPLHYHRHRHRPLRACRAVEAVVLAGDAF